MYGNAVAQNSAFFQQPDEQLSSMWRHQAMINRTYTQAKGESHFTAALDVLIDDDNERKPMPCVEDVCYADGSTHMYSLSAGAATVGVPSAS